MVIVYNFLSVFLLVWKDDNFIFFQNRVLGIFQADKKFRKNCLFFFLFLFLYNFFFILYILYLDKAESLNLYPAVERVEKKKGSKFSIICTTEHMQYHSRRFNWFKDSKILTDMTLVIRHSAFVRLNFVSLKLDDSGMYKCNITDDPKVPERRFHLIVFGKSF